MSTFEQNIAPNAKKASKKDVFESGTPLAKHSGVKRSITYKEITLLLGIAVAIVIALTLWIHDPEQQSSTHSSIIRNFNPVAVKNIIHAGWAILF
jgi:hypothetical protein